MKLSSGNVVPRYRRPSAVFLNLREAQTLALENPSRKSSLTPWIGAVSTAIRQMKLNHGDTEDTEKTACGDKISTWRLTARVNHVLHQAILGKRSAFLSRARRSRSKFHREKCGKTPTKADLGRRIKGRKMAGLPAPGIFLPHIFLPDGFGRIPATEGGKKWGQKNTRASASRDLPAQNLPAKWNGWREILGIITNNCSQNSPTRYTEPVEGVPWSVVRGP